MKNKLWDAKIEIEWQLWSAYWRLCTTTLTIEWWMPNYIIRNTGGGVSTFFSVYSKRFPCATKGSACVSHIMKSNSQLSMSVVHRFGSSWSSQVEWQELKYNYKLYYALFGARMGWELNDMPKNEKKWLMCNEFCHRHTPSHQCVCRSRI